MSLPVVQKLELITVIAGKIFELLTLIDSKILKQTVSLISECQNKDSPFRQFKKRQSIFFQNTQSMGGPKRPPPPYALKCSNMFDLCVLKETTENSFTITGLTAGTEYQFRLVAYNLAGSSKPSEPSETVKPPGKNFQIFLQGCVWGCVCRGVWGRSYSDILV